MRPGNFSVERDQYVVHLQYGIGCYKGIETKLDYLGNQTDFFIVEYAKSSKLLVPVSQAHLITRYVGARDTAPSLHILGSKVWDRLKVRVQYDLMGYARDLLTMRAKRLAHGGFSFPPDSDQMKAFEKAFPYRETEDQLSSIARIKEEMVSSTAMDHLLCGDVGYGKTEVAIRAAFKATVEGKKQVAVLVPTSVLTLQHHETFTNRMENYPVVIKSLSRFQSLKEIRAVLDELNQGKVDILIGTHRILNKDVQFRDLGLIIIDEEQKFGVRVKEKLRDFKVGVDCLTLTATPIPRTLYLSLIGVQSMSMVNSAPTDRLIGETFVVERNKAVIYEAIHRELSRGGQVYFIHNRIETVNLVVDEIQHLFPKARIGVAHGQLCSEELDTIFHAFKQGKTDILISTAIIENGIDIPNANTILVDQADHFGLADLYQLRGRVGRSNQKGYAYFLIPTQVTEMAKERLEILLKARGSGSGIQIALRDLEFRGAGNLVGVQQSGMVSAVGFHLYCKFLRRAVEAVQNQKDPFFIDTKMEFPFPASFPVEYISDSATRFELYWKIGDAVTLNELKELFESIVDRFGALPTPSLWLYHLSRIRMIATQKRYTAIKFTTSSVEFRKGNEKESRPLRAPYTPANMERQIVEWL